MQYNKIFKWLLVALFIVGAVAGVYGFINGWPDAKGWKNDKAQIVELNEAIENNRMLGAVECSKEELAQMTENYIKDSTELGRLYNEISKVKVEKKYDELYSHKHELNADLEKAKAKNQTNKIAKLQKEIEKDSLKIAPIQHELDSLGLVYSQLDSLCQQYEATARMNPDIDTLNTVKARVAKGEQSVDVILYTTYGLAAVAIIALLIVVFIITGINNWKNLIKIILILAAIIGVVIVVWNMAPGTPLKPDAEYFKNGATPPPAGDLKLADTVLYLTYGMAGAAILSLIVTWVTRAIRK